MSIEHARRVERLGLVRREHGAPDRHHQHRGHDQPGHRLAVLRPELARIDALAVQAGDQRQGAVDHGRLVEAGELGKLVELADQQARQHDEPAVANDARPGAAPPAAAAAPPAHVCRRHRLGAVEVGHDQRAHQRLEHRLLAREVEIERALGRPRPRRDVLHPRSGEALLGEHVECRVEQLGGAGVLAAAGQCGHAHHYN